MRICVRNLSFAYPSQQVLANVDLEIAEGEVLGVVGPNGAGKSTLLRAISGALRPQTGAIYLDFRSVQDLSIRERARKLAMVEQGVHPSFDLTVRELVELGRIPYLGRLDGFRPLDQAAVARALAFTGLAHLASRRWSQLSGGERQRALLALAFAQEPEVLLLDEPTAHLDIAHQIELVQLITRFAEEGKTVITALHDLNLAAAFAHRLALLHQGDLVASGPPAEVLTPANLRRVFGVESVVRVHPLTGRLYVHFLWTPRGDRPKRGHLLVVGGGGSMEALLPRLAADYTLTLGVVSPLDSDYQAAKALGIPVITEAPFSPISEAARGEFREVLEVCDGVVVGPTWFGPGNVVLLEMLSDCVARKPVVIVDVPGLPARDFTAGRATALAHALLARGARAASAEELLSAHFLVGEGGTAQSGQGQARSEHGQAGDRQKHAPITPR